MSSQSHLLNLKVMRLGRPSFSFKQGLYHDTDPQLVGNDCLLANDTTSVNMSAGGGELRLDELGISSFLVLPFSFGNIYLGESFCAYLSVNNDGNVPVEDVSFKAELQTTSQRLTLANSNPSSNSNPGSQTGSMIDLTGGVTTPKNTSLLPGQSSEFILNHEIKELGVHILVCSVQYTPSPPGNKGDRERKFFRKFYKFQVLNPLSVKTRVNTLADARITLETQIQNLATIPMCLDRVLFEQNPLFHLQDFNTLPDASSVFGNSHLIGSQEVRQYLYILIPKSRDFATRTTPNLGKLDIGWSTGLGIPGRLQTSQLIRKVPTVEPFEVSIVKQPNHLEAEKPFRLTLRVRNNLPDEKVRITVQGVKSKMSQVLIMGSNYLDLGPIDPSGHIDFDMSFFTLVPGHHKISGLKIEDKISGLSRDIDALGILHIL
ncbi:hypothetical protein EDD86DRAFT_200727 [Gorgonomyces haynaldii]|nr:hypothetical protein EDD86DRAFT_200727 [Gorgonomyces haynaldii]